MRVLFYGGPVSDLGIRNAQILIADAHRSGAQEVLLCLSSEGGDVASGLTLTGLIRLLPIVVNTHAVGICGSIAATIFMSGARRTCDPATQFVLHQASVGGTRAKSTELIAQPFRADLNWSDEDMAARFGPADFSISSDEAKKLGIVHQIQEHKILPSDDFSLIKIPT